MSDQERILKLLENGKISKEQAEELLEALDNFEEAVTAKEFDPLKELQNYDKELFPEVNRGLQNPKVAQIVKLLNLGEKAPFIELPEIPPIPTSDALAYNLGIETGDLLPHQAFLETSQWVRVVSTSGDVRVQVDPELVSPIAYGDNGALPIMKPNGKLNVVVVNEDLELILPRNYGVMLDVKSGDVDIEQGFVIGKVLSGDVTLEAVIGVIMTVMSGDVHANLRLTTDKHAIKVLSGDANVHILPGSSVRVEGSVRSGTISLDSKDHKFTHIGYLGQRRFNAAVGKAEAELELSALSGDLRLEVVDD
jgi:DUF4097 and DUF4098 domain-containing protein YvlB